MRKGGLTDHRDLTYVGISWHIAVVVFYRCFVVCV